MEASIEASGTSIEWVTCPDCSDVRIQPDEECRTCDNAGRIEAARPLALSLNAETVIASIANFDDDTIASFYAANRADKSDVIERHAAELGPFTAFEQAITIEIERRLKERRADPDAKVAIPHAQLIIELEPVFAPYIFSIEGLKKAAAMLAPEEAKKIVKYMPAHVDPVPEKWEPGLTASIKAIRDKYPGSEVAKILEESMDHPRTGDRLTIKLREFAPKNIRPQQIPIVDGAATNGPQ